GLSPGRGRPPDALERPAPELEVGQRSAIAGGQDREPAQRRLGPQGERAARLVVGFVDDPGPGGPAENLLDPGGTGPGRTDDQDLSRGCDLVGGRRAVG